MILRWKSFFRGESLFLDCKDARDLVRPQWPIGARAWVIYRLFTALYISTMLVVMFSEKFSRYQWKVLIAFTHWSYFVLTLCYVLKILCLFKYYHWLKEDPNEKVDELSPLIEERSSWNISNIKSPLLLRISWLVSNLAMVFAFYITCDYYVRGAVPNPANKMIDLQIHGVNAIFAGIEILLCATPTYFVHIYQPLMFLSTYEAFTAFYYIAGGTDKNGSPALYPWYDWRRPTDLIILSFLYSLLGVSITHTTICLVSKIRNRINSYYSKGGNNIANDIVT